MIRTVMWFRRDLRLADNPALLDAVGEADPSRTSDGEVLALFVVDPSLWRRSGPARRAYLVDSLRCLDRSLGGALVIRHGDPERVVPRLASEIAAERVHIAADFGPYGGRRDDATERELARIGVPLVRTGSPYAVSPGRIRKSDGTPYRVFTPFSRAWADHGWRAPAATPDRVRWLAPADLAEGNDPWPERPDVDGLPEAGERAAHRRWSEFLAGGLRGYAEGRDRPDLDGTSRLSVHLKWGEVHPRTLLDDLARRRGDADVHRFRTELAWREFYADVLFHRPDSARDSLQRAVPDDAWATGRIAEERFAAWAAGRTGYPFVDAGMRQLLATGWMHNRVRMVTASFLVKDLHIHWRRGAAHFMQHLHDGDLASNQHGWQWVSGTGTDAAPYFRVFNPVAQGRRYDPGGDYVRTWVTELAGVPGPDVHEPWRLPTPTAGYPERIVDHGVERARALADHARRNQT